MGEHSEGLNNDRRPPPSGTRNALTASSSSASASVSNSAAARPLSQLHPNTPRDEHSGTGHSHGQAPDIARSDPQARDRAGRTSDMTPPVVFPSSRCEYFIYELTVLLRGLRLTLLHFLQSSSTLPFADSSLVRKPQWRSRVRMVDPRRLQP